MRQTHGLREWSDVGEEGTVRRSLSSGQRGADDSSNDPPVLAVRDVSRRYGDALVLDAVDLDVRAGEVHALLGENGAGKSTLIKVIAGVVVPDSGRVTVAGTETPFRVAAGRHDERRLDAVPGAGHGRRPVGRGERLPRKACAVARRGSCAGARSTRRSGGSSRSSDRTIDVRRDADSLTPGRKDDDRARAGALARCPAPHPR